MGLQVPQAPAKDLWTPSHVHCPETRRIFTIRLCWSLLMSETQQGAAQKQTSQRGVNVTGRYWIRSC